jgi:tRNA (cmo5U34)-methyltransferase
MSDPDHLVSELFHWDPETYLEMIRAEIPAFDRLQEATIDAIDGEPARVLDLGIGTGETSRRLLERCPEAEITGLDSSAAMVFRARELGIDVRLARMEDPLPDGPWDLVIAVLSVHHLTAPGKRDLFRRVREQASALVIGDVFAADPQVTRIDPERDFPEPSDEVAAACGGEVRWRHDDLAVIAARYA